MRCASSILLAACSSAALVASMPASAQQAAPAGSQPTTDQTPAPGQPSAGQPVSPQTGQTSAPDQDQGATTSPATTAGEDVVVTGIRQSLAAAANIKRNADQVVDSIVAQDIGKFPDPTVASALQRIPGVQVVVGDNNEIVNPLVRGLGDILTTLNGREIFTGAGRGFSFQDLPAQALAGADVYKSNSANLIEGGVAGVIDLKLHRAFDFKGFTLAGGIQNTYDLNEGQSSPSMNLLVADRFDTGIGEIGVLVSGSWSHNNFDRPVAFDDLLRSGNHGPGGTTGGAAGALLSTGVGGLNQFGTYERPEVNASLQWQASPTLQFYVDGLFDGYRNTSSTSFIINDAFAGSQITNVKVDGSCNNYLVGGDGFYNAGGNTERLCNADSYTSLNGLGFTSNQAHRNVTNDYLIAGGFKFDHDRLHADVDVSYQNSSAYAKTFIIDIGKRLPEIDITTNLDHGVNFNAPGNPLGQMANYAFTNGLDDDRSISKGNLFAAQGDARYDVGGFIKDIEIGGRYARRIGQFQQVIVNPAAPGGPYATLLSSVGIGSDFFEPVPGVPRIYGGDPFLVPATGQLLDETVENRLRSIFNVAQGDQPYDPQRSFYARENTYAGYAQGKYEIAFGGPIKIDGLVGVRVTKTDRSISGTGAVVVPTPTAANPGATTVQLVPVTRNISDTDVLPNASARLVLGGGLQARASYAKVLSRPDFGSLNPGLNYFVSTNPNIQNGGNSGNPDLTPQKADEYDATLEYYFGRSNYLAVGVYQKDITGRVVTQGVPETIGGINYLISQPRNVGSAKLKGIEASGQFFFDFLPGALAGLGTFGNFTLADSKVLTKSDPLYGLPLLGVSKYNYNAGVTYEKYGMSIRAVYNFRSHYYDGDNTTSVNLRPVGQSEFLNGVRPNGRLDFSVNYDVTKNLTLTVDGTNVTRSKYESYYGSELNPHDIRFDDTSYSIGARVRF